jgi:hypothetical protein
MTIRSEMLTAFGLPDRETFEIEPHRDDFGLWRIKVSHDGDPALLMDQGHATRLADAIRDIDRPLADQINACLQKARRYSGISN